MIRKPPILWACPDSELSLTLDMALSHYRQLQAEPFCLQIGAFDGVAGDPIYPLVEKHALRGVLVEPQTDAFEKLRVNYAKFGDRFTLVNAAIAPADGKRPLYRVRKSAGGPEWLPQLASFDRNIVMKHRGNVPKLESLLVVDEVPCVTFPNLLRAAGACRIDVLQIDAEGYDAEILRLFDLHYHKPAIVHFEHKHLNRKEHEACIRELIGLGYKLALSPDSTLAYLIR